jgi:hypothetical protein
MTIIFVFIPFVAAFLLVCVVKFILIANKNTAPIGIVTANKITITAISSDIFCKVKNINSNHNTPFRSDVSSTCLEYLYNQKIDVGNKNENTILTCLGGKL